MRGKSFGTELKCMCVCVHTRSHTFGWCLDVPSVPGLHLWESGAGGELENTRGSSRRIEGEREREGGLLMHEGRGGSRAAEQSCAEEECRLFPCVGRTGEPSWLQAGAVSP